MRGTRGARWGSLLALVLWNAPVTAQGESWLRVSAPAGCPDHASIEARVEELLGRPVERSEELDVRAVITSEGGGWEVDVTLVVGKARGTRRLRAPRCSDAADFVAVTTVLALDPSRPGSELEPEVALLAALPDAPVRPPPPPPAWEAEPRRSSKGRPGTRHVFLTAGAEALWGTLPSVRVGPTASFAVNLGSVLVALGGSYFPEVPEGAHIAENPVLLSLVHARARGCWVLGSSELSGGPCVHLDLGAMMADEAVTGGRRATELYVALGSGLRGMLRLTPHLSLIGQAGFAVPVTQPRFVLSDGTLLHQPQLGGTASLELSLNFPEVTKTGAVDTE